MTDIRNALTRKIGPLAAWVWLTLFAGAVFLWRRRSGGGTVGGASNDTGIPQDDTTATEKADPVVLQPGETAFDPNTEQTVSGAALPQDPAPVADPQAPIVLGPGEVAYDPATGRVIAGQATNPEDAGGTDAPDSPQTSKGGKAAAAHKPSALDRAKAAVRSGKLGPRNRARLTKAGYTKAQIDYHLKRHTPLAKPAVKQHPKPRTQHQASHPVKHPTAQTTRPRSHGAVKHPVPRPKTAHHPAAASPKPRAPAAAAKPAAPRTRPTVAHAAPVVRQRPAPAHTTPKKKKKG